MWPEDPVDAAVARGDFDDLPLAGTPLHLPSSHDPDWWIKQRIREGDVDRDALLPVVVLLRREFARRDETLTELRSEQSARDYAEDYTRRVRDDRLRNPWARMLAPEMDVEETVRRWRELRATGNGHVEAGDAPGGQHRGPRAEAKNGLRRRWWPFGRFSR